MSYTKYLLLVLLTLLAVVLCLLVYVGYYLLITPHFSPLHNLPGPPVSGVLGSHMHLLLNASISARETEKMVKQYGRNFRVIGLGAHDERLMTVDPVAVSHVLNRSTVYEKPWQSRRLITRLIGEGLLGSEGNVHKRQRKVSNPAFSQQNLRALLPIFFQKAEELRVRWSNLITNPTMGTKLDVCHWFNRATFDIIGLTGFDYAFNAIHDETNEVYLAYRDMFEIAFSRGQDLKTVFGIYFPWVHTIWPDEKTRVIDHSQEVIHRVGRRLVQEKKKHLLDNTETGSSKDLLSLLLKSNLSTDTPVDQRISDDDILNQISTFLFAGSDTSSLTLTWTLYLLAKHRDVQDSLRKELLGIRSKLGDSWIVVDETVAGASNNHTNLFSAIDALSLLHRVLRESIRLIPAVHSSIRVATEDDEIPLSEPVVMKDGTKRSGVKIKKGQFVHVAIESFNLDRSVWGETGWEFDPDRWLDLPEKAKQQPGLFPNVLTFSAGPRSCIGMTFSMMEMKVILYTLLTSFEFSEPDDIVKANVVLTRPFLRGKPNERSQCPMIVRPWQNARM